MGDVDAARPNALLLAARPHAVSEALAGEVDDRLGALERAQIERARRRIPGRGALVDRRDLVPALDFRAFAVEPAALTVRAAIQRHLDAVALERRGQRPTD